MDITHSYQTDVGIAGLSVGELPQHGRDLLPIIAGNSPESKSRRSPSQSRALLEQLLVCWQILPSMQPSLVNGVLKEILQPDEYRRLRHAWLATIAFAKAQVIGCSTFLQALEHRRLSYSLLKGAATAFQLYPAPYMRAAWDFDIGVARHDLAEAEALAIASGFHRAQQDPETKRFHRSDPYLRALVERQHYELGFLVRRLQVTNLPPETLEAIRVDKWTHQYWLDVDSDIPWCYAVVDIHHALALDMGLDDLLASVRTIRTSGLTLKVPDNAWLAAHLVYKLYWEGVHGYEKGLYQYADLVRLAPNLDAVTFDHFVDILRNRNLLAAGYYVFRRLPEFGISLPPYALRFIEQAALPPKDSEPTQVNDLGDMWPKLWGRR
jgi:hypothetical protein